jgi:exosome complex RNA-binding protein Rrp4
MQVLHTDEDPPNHGRIILATTGWIWNSKKAERKTVVAKRPIRSNNINDQLYF